MTTQTETEVTMRANVQAKALRAALTLVKPAAPTRTTLPVLSNVLIEADADGLRVACTDLDVGAQANVDASVGEPGAVTVPVKALMKALTKAGDVTVQLAVENGDTLALDVGGLRVKLYGLSADEFPRWPEYAAWKRGPTLEGSQLVEWSKRIAPFCSTEESRPILQCVHLYNRGDALGVEATNGHRLMRHVTGIEAPKGFDVLLPGGFWKLAGKVYKKAGAVTMEYGTTHVRFLSEGLTVFARQTEGPYPNADPLFPRECLVSFESDTAELLNAVERVGSFASYRTHRIRLTLNGGPNLNVSTNTPDEGTAEADVAVWGGHGADPFVIGFNAQYLAQVLKALEADRVRFQLTTPERCAVIGAAEPNGYVSLVMPLRLLD